MAWTPDPTIPNSGPDNRGNNSVDYWIHNQQNPYVGATDTANQLNQQAWAAYQNIFGRAPTNTELAQVIPAFQSGGISGGVAAVAGLKNTPLNQVADQQAELLKNAPQHFGDVTNQFQSILGRAPTQDELNHFGSLMATGTVDAYQMQDFLKSQPEYQQKQVDALSGKLSGYDKQYYQEQILPATEAAFAKQGRSLDSSGFSAALGQTASQQNIDRQKYLAGLTVNNNANAYQQYVDSVNQNKNLQYTSATAGTNRLNQYQDYAIQQNAYNQYLSRYGKRQSNAGAYGSLIGGTLGGVAGGIYGDPAGAYAGYTLGSGLGGAAGNIYGNQNY